jgi:hypothetical protein
VAAVVAEIILISVTIIAVSIAVVVVSRYSKIELRPDVNLEVSAWENDQYALPAGENDFFKIFHRGREPVLSTDLRLLVERIAPNPLPQTEITAVFSDNLITTGETVYLRKCRKPDGSYFNLSVGDYLHVTIVHRPSGALLFDGKVLVENAL